MKLFAVTMLLLARPSLAAQTETAKPSTIFEKLTATEGIELTLEADLTTFIGQKKTNNYLPGKLRMKDGKTYSVEVRPRGRYRRKMSVVPPMKIRFNEQELRAEGLDTLNEIKIALPCYDTYQGDELIAKEYLAYRMFEKMSDAHFRAGLVKITLIDTNEKGAKKKEMNAIFVEDEEDVAARLGGVIEEEFGTQTNKMEQQQAAKVVLFQYLIGNTDWDFTMHRNVELIRQKDGKILALPYDFDFSGLVSAPYASPSSDTGLKSVRDRYLMSADLDADAVRAATQLVLSKEKELLKVCRSKLLSYATKSDMERFLEMFFKNMEGKDTAPPVMLEKKE